LDIKTLQAIIPGLPPHIATLLRGPTGVGKSHISKGIADSLNLPFVDVRGSTMDEAKVGGIPDFETSKERGVSTFCLPSWYVRACKEPVVLMLDELNRSMPQVQQAFFQIVLDRELGNDVDGVPMRLHPETRIIAAVNVGSEYDVNDMDPALLRRFWVADLEPTLADWTDWAESAGIDSVLIEFVGQNPEHWMVDVGSVEPGTVVPTPASWHRLDETFKSMTMDPSTLIGKPAPSHFYSVAMGFVGTEAAISFCDFVKNYERQISAEDILEGKVNASDIKDLPASSSTGLIDKLGNHSKDNTWNKKEIKRVAEFARVLGGEMLIATFTAIQKSSNTKNLMAINKEIGQEVVALVNSARSTK
jgi:hypothetical protein